MIQPIHRQWLVSGVAALILLFALSALFAPRPKEATPFLLQENAAGNSNRLLADHRSALAFFDAPAAVPDGKGLFATDFFKPPPAKAGPSKPPPPATREAALVYRGFAELPGGVRLAYIEVDGRVRTLTANDAVLAGWALASFDQDTAVLAREGEKQDISFNRRRTLTVPAGAK